MMQDNLVCEVRTGSHAYGTNLPTSDLDTRGIFVADPVCVRTPFFNVNEVEDKKKEDTKFYEVGNFVKLLVDQNPNILELLWVDESDILYTTPAYDLLRSHRHALLSSKLSHTFSGYALSQLKRIKGHNKWINNPQPVDAPRQDQFVSVVFNMTGTPGLNKHVPTADFMARSLGANMFALYYDDGGGSWMDAKGNPTPKSHDYWNEELTSRTPQLIVKVNEDQYKAAHDNWKNFWEWKKNRNEARSELEEQFGYDTKHAMHLIRLLRMGYEALTEGVVKVKRLDAKELLSIRYGAFKYEELVSWAEALDAQVKAAYETTKLPRSVNVVFASELVMEVQDLMWNR